MVALAAAATGASAFGGWSGACSGLDPGACSVTMDGAKSVGAAFDLDQFSLSVSLEGTGGGSVTSAPGSINCPTGTCADSYTSGTLVTLTAAPDTTSTFAGWTGCSSTGTYTCQTTVNSATSVTASFTRITYTLNVSKIGPDDGLVWSDPAGINCAAGTSSTSAVFDASTVVELTGVDGATSVFTGWSGSGCSGTAPCDVTMDATKQVYANYCTPLECLANSCDVMSDGCIDTIDCGDCPGAFSACGGLGVDNVCGTSNTHSIDLEADSNEFSYITDEDQDANGNVLGLTGDFTLELWVQFESPARQLPGLDGQELCSQQPVIRPYSQQHRRSARAPSGR